MTYLEAAQTAIVLPFDLPTTKAHVNTEGYTVIRGLFSPPKVAELRDTFAGIYTAEPVLGLFRRSRKLRASRLCVTRALVPHHFDETSKRALLQPNLRQCLETLLGEATIYRLRHGRDNGTAK